MDQWEIVKKTFNGQNPDKIYRLNLPALSRTLSSKKIGPTSFDFDDHDVLITGFGISLPDLLVLPELTLTAPTSSLCLSLW